MRQLVIEVADETRIGEVRRAAVRLADAAGFAASSSGAVAVVASELATNLVRYARGGRMFVGVHGTGDCAQIELLSVDAGPGMSDVQRCMQDGYSSADSRGTGLGAVRRLAIEFDIHSAPDRGTVVLARVGAKALPARFAWAGLSTCAPREDVCGDAWRVETRDDAVAVLVADGLGHGPLAGEAAAHAVRAFEQEPFSAPAATCTRAHRALAGSRGAALAVALVSGSQLQYAGVGNIAGAFWHGGQQRGLPSQNGTGGLHVRTPHEYAYTWNSGGVLIMHSDGLSSRWSLGAEAGLATRHPAVIAGVLHRDALRGRDDASVVVIRDMARPRREGDG